MFFDDGIDGINFQNFRRSLPSGPEEIVPVFGAPIDYIYPYNLWCTCMSVYCRTNLLSQICDNTTLITMLRKHADKYGEE